MRNQAIVLEEVNDQNPIMQANKQIVYLLKFSVVMPK